MNNKKKLVIIGDSSFAQIAFEYFNHDSFYKVVGFAVEEAFRTRDTLFDLPIVDFNRITSHFPYQEHDAFVAISYLQLNRIRTRLYLSTKDKGYKLANYISSKAFCWSNVKLGENVFIFEGNTVQPFVTIGNNVILWSGNHIGHHSNIKDNCFISSQVVVSGHCEVGRNCFMGVNSTIANNLTIADDCFIGMGAVVAKSTQENNVYKGNPAIHSTTSAKRLFKVQE